jgi:uncharacterized membrane protein
LGLKEFLKDHLKGLGYMALGVIVILFALIIFNTAATAFIVYQPWSLANPTVNPLMYVFGFIALVVALIGLYFARKGFGYLRHYW